MRQSWDDYFLGIARAVGERSTCFKRKVGCVITQEHIILSTGYNGSVREAAHCEDEGVGCLLDADGDCIRTVHAEANAVAQAARIGTHLVGSVVYVTALPCWDCYKLLANAGVFRVLAVKHKELDYELVSPTMGLEWVCP